MAAVSSTRLGWRRWASTISRYDDLGTQFNLERSGEDAPASDHSHSIVLGGFEEMS